MKLKKIEVNAFAGISPDSPVVLDFTESKFIKLAGDQGVGKTSLLNALLVACGQLSKNDKDFINLQSGKIDINFSFVGKDRLTYDVRCTKSSFSLTYEGALVPEPISKMKELLGVCGVSPMEIKNKPLKEIVKWLSAYSNKSAEEFEADMLKFKNGLKSSREDRALANKSAKAIAEYLDNDEMFINWAESEAKYVKDVDIKELSETLDKAGRESDKYIQAEAKLKQLNERKTLIEEQIAQLVAQAEQIEKQIKIGDDFIAKNKGAKKEYDVIKEQYDNAAQEAINFNHWQEVKKKKADMDKLVIAANKADDNEKKILQKVKELQAEILPDIKGVSLVTEDTVEDGKTIKEGLYWNGKNFAQLSESETWKIVIEIWRKYKVRVAIIDNYQSLGTMAVEILEKLHNDGCYILAAEMHRDQKSLQINYE